MAVQNLEEITQSFEKPKRMSTFAKVTGYTLLGLELLFGGVSCSQPTPLPTNQAPIATFYDDSGNSLPNPYSALAGSTVTGTIKFVDPEGDDIDVAVFNYEDMLALDTNPDPSVVEAPFSLEMPAGGVTEEILAESIDIKNNVGSQYLKVTGEFPPIEADIIASVYGFYHDNDSNTIETVLTDNTDSSFFDQYDTAKFYLAGNLIGSTTPGGSASVKDTSNIVGSGLEVKMELYKAGELVGTRTENNINSLNHVPDFPQVDELGYDATNDGFVSGAAGTNFIYDLNKNDLDGDSLTLITEYFMVNPADVYIFDLGTRYRVDIVTDGWTPGVYHMKHRVQDSHNGETNYEDIYLDVQ